MHVLFLSLMKYAWLCVSHMHREEYTAGCGGSFYALWRECRFNPWHKWPTLIFLHEKPTDECDTCVLKKKKNRRHIFSHTAHEFFHDFVQYSETFWRQIIMMCNLNSLSFDGFKPKICIKGVKYVRLWASISLAKCPWQKENKCSGHLSKDQGQGNTATVIQTW